MRPDAYFNKIYISIIKMANPVEISFSELRHANHFCNSIPIGIAMVARYALHRLDNQIKAAIFKDPLDFIKYLNQRNPKIACFSNYIWNTNLSYNFARQIKERSPESIIVFGGPDYPIDTVSQEKFLLTHPIIDFYVFRDGEFAFVELYNTLEKYNFDVSLIKKERLTIPSCHYLSDGKLVQGSLLDQPKNLDELPSPYLSGLCDKFLNDGLLPTLQTTRGCPFRCTFCQEGDLYYNKVKRFSFERVKQELDYVAKRADVSGLLIVDSNFGMYKDDVEICHYIASIQQKYNWPRFFMGMDGKNQKARILEASALIKGTYLGAATQSTSQEVLANVKRQNVSWSDMVLVAKEAEVRGANSFSEIILGLPGDSKEAHFKSIFCLIDAGINVVRSHQFIMLYGSETATKESREKYEMVTRFRVTPNTVRFYELDGKRFLAMEVDEICVANKTMSFEDYLECRKFTLTVEIFYNNGIFQELIKFLKRFNISISSFIMNIHQQAPSSCNALSELYKNFLRETHELWNTKEELDEFLKQPGVIDRYISGELGNNEQLMYRAFAVFKHIDELHKVAFHVAKEMLFPHSEIHKQHFNYLDELHKFSLLCKKKMLSVEANIESVFHYDFIQMTAVNFKEDPLAYYKPDGINITIAHTDNQKDMISQFIRMYGLSNYGLGNISGKVSEFYRKANYSPPVIRNKKFAITKT